MQKSLTLLFSIILAFIIGLIPVNLYASNSNWLQSDWSGGSDTGAVAVHPNDQTGWTKFYSKETHIDISVPGQLSLSPHPNSLTQTGDILDFDRGTLTNLRLVGNGSYITTRYEETNAAVTKTGVWNNYTAYTPSGGTAMFSSNTGDSVTLSFNGTQATWIGLKGPNRGKANVYLDNILQGSVDLYSGVYLSQQLLWSISGLTNSLHTLKIVVSGTRNASSIGYAVDVDAFDVSVPQPDSGAYLTLIDDIRYWMQTSDLYDFDRGTLTNLRLVGNGSYSYPRYEETNAAVTKTGVWNNYTAYTPSGGTAMYSSNTGDSVTLSFNGTQATWIGLKGPNRGKANVFLDNILQGSVDLYGAVYLSQQQLWSISGLTNSLHTLKIVVSGTKNASSIGYAVDVDAFDVVVVNQDPNAYLTLSDVAVSGTYESPSFDVGSGGGIFSSISWTAAVPAGTSLRFQIATNNDNLIWNFIGPDGTSNTYYDASDAVIYSGHNGARYIKYKSFLNRPATTDASPALDSVRINYGLVSLLHGVYESPSFDLGLGGGYLTTISWTATVPSLASLRFQIATNNDNLTWNYIGPDGTSNTYYATPGSAIFAGHSGFRYIRYKSYFDKTTINPADSPILNDVTLYSSINPPVQWLVSSPFDTADATNVINRLQWTELLVSGTDVVLQLRTSSNGATWGSWYGPHNTTFSASSGVTQITVGSTDGLYVGNYVTLTNSVNSSQMEIKKVTVINSGTTITLDSATSFSYASNSILTDTYTDPDGREIINPLHKSGGDDQWIQYRVFLTTINGTATPVFLENKLGYFTANGLYKPDGVIDGNGNNIYAATGSGSGGASAKTVNPGFIIQQPLTYDIRIQNDGNSESIDDMYSISWNTPSDVSGNWTVSLNDGTADWTSPFFVPLQNAGSENVYTLKVTPSSYAPAGSSKDIILDIHSESDYSKVDSVKATAIINSVYQVDGIIDGDGDNIRDLCTPACAGSGGTSSIKEAVPGDIVQYNITLQNEGNLSDSYTVLLINPLPNGWKVLINNGSQDFDLTPYGWTTPAILSPPNSGTYTTFTLRVIPKGVPATENIILGIYSNTGARHIESLTARLKLNGLYKVDGIINSYTISGGGCGSTGSGDNIYGATGSGAGGCTGVDIPAGASKEVAVGIQNEGNLKDNYMVSWNTPSGWGVVMVEKLNDGSTIEFNIPPFTLPTPLAGNPSNYNPGEVPYFTFKITAPPDFIFGSQSKTIIIDVKSFGDNTKIDSVKVVVNSTDTTPPSPVILTPGSITTKSVKISWTAPGDDGSSGAASSYDLRYSTALIATDNEFNNAEKVNSCKANESNIGKPKSSGSSESCTVSGLFADTDYYFAIKSTDDAGNTSPISTCSACPAHTPVSNDAVMPGNITDLAVTGSSKDTVTLCWTAKSDDGSEMSSDAVTAYDLRYSRRYIVEDSVAPGIGETAFSNAISVTPSGGFLPPKSQGMKECYIVPVTNKIDLGGGIIEDRTQNTRFYFAVKALDEARNKSSISNVSGGLTTLVPNAYSMVSVPYKPVPNTPADVFGDDVGAQMYVYEWDSRGPNWTNGCYNGWPLPHNLGNDICSQLTSIAEGQGYFLWTPSANINIDVPAASTVPVTQDCTDDTLPVPVHFQCYAMPLKNGWNMIGTPFDKEIYFSSRDVGGNIERGLYIRKTTGSNTDIAKFQDAVTSKNWIDGSVYTFNGTTYTYETCNQDNAGEPLGTQCSLVLQPWKAYWSRVHGGGSSTFELLIPN